MAEARKVEDEQRRIRTLTVKGQEDFQSKVYLYTTELEHAWSVVKKELDKTISFEGKASELKSHEQAVCFNYGEFRIKFNQFHDFLDRTRSEDSNQLLRKLSDQGTQRDKQVNSVLNTLDSRKIDMDNQSQHSHKSKASSSRSSVSSKGSLVARAKLEGAKARMRVLEEEIELRKKQALLQEERAITIAKSEREDKEYEANISLLQEKKAIAEAAAETEVYETEQNENEHERVDQNYVNERTSQFILDHPVEKMSVIHTDGLNVKSPQPPSNHNIDNVTKGELHVGEQIGRFLVKKDMLINRFTKFDDDPVHYNVWKNTFRSVAVELGTSASEEIDLLVKWLGPETTRQALSIRVASSYNPESGLLKIWERLDARYGAPELVEKSTQMKVTNFAKITANNYHRLYELTDILSEIESLKVDPQYSVLLSYYDSSVGVNPIVSKLPYHLQNKWANRAMKYKLSHRVCYPPFEYFVDFVKQMCSLHNDPSFVFDSPSNKTVKNVQITTKKTDIDTIKWKCLLHPESKSHSLETCREFRKMQIEDRRQYLKDNKICFRCCGSDQHMIRDCKVDISCEECGSKKHVTALHLFKHELKPVQKFIQNEKLPADDNINCKFAQICGDSSLSKSCAKIVKVKVYHKSNPLKKKNIYAIIDEQSNRSLACSKLLDCFIDTCSFQDTTYSLHTCSGNMTTCGRKGVGFVIEGLNGNKHDLPSLTECNEIPDNKDEIPTPEVVGKYHHLSRIVNQIPHVEENVSIQMLIGRDLQEVHYVHEQIIGPSGPYAQQLSLGWVVIGETCTGNTPHVTVMKTHLRQDGRQSIFPACESKFVLEEDIDMDIFVCSQEDNQRGLSVEDRQFMEIVKTEGMEEDRSMEVMVDHDKNIMTKRPSNQPCKIVDGIPPEITMLHTAGMEKAKKRHTGKMLTHIILILALAAGALVVNGHEEVVKYDSNEKSATTMTVDHVSETMNQFMADLPVDRLTPSPPFVCGSFGYFHDRSVLSHEFQTYCSHLNRFGLQYRPHSSYLVESKSHSSEQCFDIDVKLVYRNCVAVC